MQFNRHEGIGKRNALIALNAFVKNEGNLNFLLLRFVDLTTLSEVVAFSGNCSSAFGSLSILFAKTNLNTENVVAEVCRLSNLKKERICQHAEELNPNRRVTSLIDNEKIKNPNGTRAKHADQIEIAKLIYYH
ncbi:hypothetical protein T01_3042 [Trichinella spiralis]|uniref:Uncharacterized protein n=1 Tax=Trichinella spiralis TaxID=6334 RepID=A0A0V1C187_TRISP|nr:hypothetical protein T01_3042 [Trichinella spiralis]